MGALRPGGGYGPGVQRRIVRGSEGLGLVLDDATWQRLDDGLDGFDDPALDAIAVRNQHARARVVQRLLAYRALPPDPEALADAVGRLP